MTFSELGSAFRDARIAQGFSLEYVAEKLKLTVRMVEALENGDVDSLPHAVYTRGFIRVYASIIHIDLAPYQAVIDEQFPRDAHDEYEQKITLVPAVRKRSRTKRLFLLTFFIMCGLLFGAYWQYSKKDEVISQAIPLTQSNPSANTQVHSKPQNTPEKQQGVTQTSPAKMEVSSSHSDAIAEATPHEDSFASNKHIESQDKQSISTQEEKVDSGQDEAAQEARDAVETTNTAKQVNPASEKKTKETTESSPVEVPSLTTHTANTQSDVVDITDTVQDAHAPYEMVITAVEDCWLRIQTDKNKSSQFVLKKGQSFTRRFHNRLEARFGNAGGIRLRYNGQDIPAPGALGEVANIVYPPEN